MKLFARGILFLIVFGSSLCQAQNLLSLVPNNAKSIKCVDGDRIRSKLDFDKIIKREDFIDYEVSVVDNIRDKWNALPIYSIYKGISFGVNTDARYYSYAISNDSVYADVSLFEIADATKFTRKIEFWLEDDFDEIVDNFNDYSYFIEDEMLVAWSDKILIFMNIDFDYRYLSINGGDEDYYIEELSEAEESKRDLQLDERKKEFAKKEFVKLIELPYDSSIFSDQIFISSLAKDYDSFEYAPEFSMNFNRRKSYSSYLKEQASEKSTHPYLMDNHRLTSYVLNGNSLDTRQNFHLNQNLSELLQGCFTTKFGKNWKKHISCAEPLAYFTMSLSPKGIAKLFSEIDMNLGSILPGMSSSSKYTGILMSLIDKKKALNLLKGNFVMAITGTKAIDVRYESFNYDNQTGDRERIIKTRKEQLAEYVCMLETGEPEIIESFLESMIDQNEFKDLGGYYRIKSNRNNYSVKSPNIDTYLTLVDGLIILSNSETTVKDALSGKNKGGLSKEWINRMTENAINNYSNIDRIADIDQVNGANGIPTYLSGLFRTMSNGFNIVSGHGVNFDDNTAVMTSSIQYENNKNTGAIYDIINMLTSVKGNNSLQSFNF